MWSASDERDVAYALVRREYYTFGDSSDDATLHDHLPGLGESGLGRLQRFSESVVSSGAFFPTQLDLAAHIILSFLFAQLACF